VHVPSGVGVRVPPWAPSYNEGPLILKINGRFHFSFQACHLSLSGQPSGPASRKTVRENNSFSRPAQ
ncbi:MAG: hypothetical protein V4488_10090, partial [Pseudomonadota bacterium]